MNLSKRTNLLVKGAILLAVSFVLTFLEFPVIPAVPWLKLDFSAVPLLLAALLYGPFFGLILTAMLQILDIFIKGSQTGGVGQLANFLLLGLFIITISLIYKRDSSKKTLPLAMFAGTIALIIGAIVANHFILVPLFSPGLTKNVTAYREYLFKWIPIFNLIKGFVLSLISYFLFAKLSPLMNKEYDYNKNLKKA